MKRIGIPFTIFALGLLLVQPLHAEIIHYTFQADMSTGGTVVFDFSLDSTIPHIGEPGFGTGSDYDIPVLTLSFSGTSYNGNYTFYTGGQYASAGFFPSTGSGLPDTFYIHRMKTPNRIDGYLLQNYSLFVDLPTSFFGDSDVPPYLAPLTQSDIINFIGGITLISDDTGPGTYHRYDITLSNLRLLRNTS